ncbi:hypothetical protein Syun_008964 [Stephania yunnanensis]|uniref:Secreted protein n=1 Tax=Stephania yunnanensis TaxID=152371 RepID=A0AAP0PQG7_9MAGN
MGFLCLCSFGWYAPLFRVLCASLSCISEFSTLRNASRNTYIKLSAVIMGSYDLTKGSLAFLNYLTQHLAS